jgi:hypothetical protein
VEIDTVLLLMVCALQAGAVLLLWPSVLCIASVSVPLVSVSSAGSCLSMGLWWGMARHAGARHHKQQL